MRSPLLILALVTLLTPTSFLAAQPKHDITVDDYFTQADLFHLAVSPKGEMVAYTEGRWQQSTDDRKTELWVVGTHPSKKDSRRLTFDRASYRFPQWSADGRWIYVLANRKREGEKKPPLDGKTQIWRISPEGGDPQPVTQGEDAVEAFEIAHDGNSLLYVMHQDHHEDDWKALRLKHANIEYGHGKHQVSQVWKLDLGTWRQEKIIDAGRFIHEFAQSPDGRRVAMITAPDEKVVSFEGRSKIDIWEVGKITTLPDKLWRKDVPSPYAWLEKLAWSGDGHMLAFNAIFDGYPAEIVLTNLAGAQPVSFLLPRPAGMHIKGYGSPLQWRQQELYFLGEEKARVRLIKAANLASDTKPTFANLTPADVVVEGFHLAQASSKVIGILADPEHFPDLFDLEATIDPAGSPEFRRRLTRVNPQTASWKLPKLSVVSWKGAGGDTVEGILELPPDYQPGKKVPLVVEIHGGPTTASYFKLQYWIYGRTLLPAKGYAVLCPNYRGSTGYGDKFLTDLVGRENDLDVGDILKGVDSLVDQGIADLDRLAVTGWSNGGYLTNCLITKTTRFKAAISGAGIVDAAMEFGSNDEPAYTIVFKQGFPWSNPDRYHKASSTYALDKVRTPTLIHVGANDDRCPPAHSRMLYRALKEYINVPTELLVYPGEAHGLMKYRNRQAKLQWDLAWLERYVLGKK